MAAYTDISVQCITVFLIIYYAQRHCHLTLLCFYTLRPFKMVKKMYNNFLEMYAGRRRRDRTHKVYIFLLSITSRVTWATSFCLCACLFVCMSTHILVNIKYRDTKFGIKVLVLYTQIEFISNVGCHAHCILQINN